MRRKKGSKCIVLIGILALAIFLSVNSGTGQKDGVVRLKDSQKTVHKTEEPERQPDTYLEDENERGNIGVSGQPDTYLTENEKSRGISGQPETALTENEKSEGTETVTKEQVLESPWVDSMIDNLTLEEKIAQLFFITPEALTGYNQVLEAGAVTQAQFNQYPVGGMVYFQANIQSGDQVKTMLSAMQRYSNERVGIPVFTGTDEEGGRVVRVAGSGIAGITNVGDMLSIGAAGDTNNAFQVGETIGHYLKQLGFNVDFAPVADIFDNENNTVIGDRSFGSDPQLVAQMVAREVEGFHEAGICATLKHFPGHGNTDEDSHSGTAYLGKSLEEMADCEWVPFQAGIEAGADFVMMGHISVPAVTGEKIPASLSRKMVTDILRKRLRFNGIIITDSLSMGAISQNYSSAHAAVQAIKAGVDMLLMPVDFSAAYQGVLDAVHRQELSEERIDESVKRILKVKLNI